MLNYAQSTYDTIIIIHICLAFSIRKGSGFIYWKCLSVNLTNGVTPTMDCTFSNPTYSLPIATKVGVIF